MIQHNKWETWRNGRIRVTYHAEWSKNYPWVLYVGGSAGQHYATIEQAQSDVRQRFGVVLSKVEDSPA